MRNALLIALGASSETRLPNVALISWSRLTIPSAERHGKHQREHLPDPRVVPVDLDAQAKVDPPERAERHRQLYERRDEDADRERVDLVFAVEVRRQHDQQHDDHDVPHRRGESGDREVVV